MSSFFTDFFRAALIADQTIMDNQKVRLVLFRLAPAMADINPAWTAMNTVDELVTSSPGWVEAAGISGYPLTHQLDVSTRVPAGSSSRYVMIGNYPFSDLGQIAEARAIGIVRVGVLNGVTDPLILVTNTPIDGTFTNVAPTDALTASPDSSFPDAANRWMFGWATASPDPIEGPLVFSRGAPEFEVSGSQHTWLYPQRANMIVNPSFEAPGVSFWSTNGTLDRVRLKSPATGGGGVVSDPFQALKMHWDVQFGGSFVPSPLNREWDANSAPTAVTMTSATFTDKCVLDMSDHDVSSSTWVLFASCDHRETTNTSTDTEVRLRHDTASVDLMDELRRPESASNDRFTMGAMVPVTFGPAAGPQTFSLEQRSPSGASSVEFSNGNMFALKLKGHDTVASSVGASSPSAINTWTPKVTWTAPAAGTYDLFATVREAGASAGRQSQVRLLDIDGTTVLRRFGGTGRATAFATNRRCISFHVRKTMTAGQTIVMQINGLTGLTTDYTFDRAYIVGIDAAGFQFTSVANDNANRTVGTTSITTFQSRDASSHTNFTTTDAGEFFVFGNVNATYDSANPSVGSQGRLRGPSSAVLNTSRNNNIDTIQSWVAGTLIAAGPTTGMDIDVQFATDFGTSLPMDSLGGSTGAWRLDAPDIPYVDPVTSPRILSANGSSQDGANPAVTWTETFDTLDAWHLAPEYVRDSDTAVPFTISSGAAVVVEAYDAGSPSGWRSGSMQRNVASLGDTQMIEAVVDSVWQFSDPPGSNTDHNKRQSIYLLTQAIPGDGTPAGGSYHAALFEFDTGSGFPMEPKLTVVGQTYIDGAFYDDGVFYLDDTPDLAQPITLRTESIGNHHTMLVNGVVVLDYDAPAIVPPYEPPGALVGGGVWAGVVTDAPDGTFILESNVFSTTMGESNSEQWTVQLMASGQGTAKVGLVYWDADYRSTGVDWGEDESWELSSGLWTHIATYRHAPDAVIAMVRIELQGEPLMVDKVLAERGYLKDWPYFDGDESYGMRDDFSWYGGTSHRGGSYSLWYNHRRAVVGRLFARTVDPNDPSQNVTDEDMEEQGLVYRWVPAGITVVPHLDVFYPFDVQNPVSSKPAGVLPYLSDSYPDGVQSPWESSVPSTTGVWSVSGRDLITPSGTTYPTINGVETAWWNEAGNPTRDSDMPARIANCTNGPGIGINALRMLFYRGDVADTPPTPDAEPATADFIHDSIMSAVNAGVPVDIVLSGGKVPTAYNDPEVKAVLLDLQQHIIGLHVLGESYSTTNEAWRAEAIAAILQVRSYGYTCPFTVMANFGGRNVGVLLAEGAAVLAADPLHNTWFGWQGYWGGDLDDNGPDDYYQRLSGGLSWNDAVAACAASSFRIQNGNCSETDFIVTMPLERQAACVAAGVGTLWWSWDITAAIAWGNDAGPPYGYGIWNNSDATPGELLVKQNPGGMANATRAEWL